MLKPHHRLYLALLPRLLRRLRWPVAANMLSYLWHGGRLRRQGPDMLPFTPISVTVWVTGRCNKACNFCYYQDELNAAATSELEMSHEQFLRLLAVPEIRRCLRICLYGGEPLLNPALPAMIRSAREQGHLVTVNTNALLVRKRLEELRSNPPDVLSISYYPEDAEVIEEAIALTAPHMPVIILYLLSRERMKYAERVVQCAVENGVRAVWFGLPSPVGMEDFPKASDGEAAARTGWPRRMVAADGPSSRAGEERPAPSLGEVPLRWDDLELQAFLRRLRGSCGNRVPLISAGIQAKGRRDTAARGITCRAFWNSLSVDAQGRVSPCCQFPLGAFADNLLAGPSSWNGERLVFLRRNLREGVVAPSCVGCPLLRQDLLGI